MSKILVKFFENGKDLCTKKLDKKLSLSEVRKKIKFENKTNILFMNEESPINIEDENDFTVEDILKDKNIYLKGQTIKLNLNNKFIIDIDMPKGQTLKAMIEKYSTKIPSEFYFLDKDQTTIKKKMPLMMKKY